MTQRPLLSRRLILPAALLVALAQTWFAGKMIVDRAALLQNGTEVVLQTGMIDPRDLFRGHYVVLNLTLSQIDAGDVSVVGDLRPYAPVWVELEPGADGFWRAKTLYATRPEAASGPLLRGTYLWSPRDTHGISFPIDRYFAPKERALELEGLRTEMRLGVVLALAPDGTAAVKGITVDGEKLLDTPLY